MNLFIYTILEAFCQSEPKARIGRGAIPNALHERETNWDVEALWGESFMHCKQSQKALESVSVVVEVFEGDFL